MEFRFRFIHLVALIFSDIINAEPVVTNATTGVTYVGGFFDGNEHFGNIKYAQDTSGARRFAPPEPFTPAPGSVVEATSRGPACPQAHWKMPPFFDIEPEISEDCLSLRIARPGNLDITSESKLPVVVWLHGGGIVKGSAYDSHFDPTNLLKLSAANHKPVIYVALNYRLGIFGFSRSQSLKDKKSLNVGIRDQRLGLEWIRDNIEAFGGDPNQITAYGLSAGGTFLSLHPMLYEGKQGVPFQQAWIMSGPPGAALNMSSDATSHHTAAVAKIAGCEQSDDAEMIDCLRNVPLERLGDNSTAYAIEVHPPAGLLTFVPSIDNDMFTDRQSNLLRDGKFVKGVIITSGTLISAITDQLHLGLRMILGWTEDEGTMNAGLASAIETEEDMITPIRQFAHALSPEQYSKLFSLYRPEDFEEERVNYQGRKNDDNPEVSTNFFRVSRILRDLLVTCSSIEYGLEMTKQSRKLNPDFTGVRFYDLNQSMLSTMFKEVGLAHVQVPQGSDINYIFNGVFPEVEGKISTEDRELAEKVTLSLINFAWTGNPVTRGSSVKHFSEWPSAYGASGDPTASDLQIQVIGGPYGTGPVSLSRNSRLGGEALGEQQVLGEGFEYGEMKSPSVEKRQRLLEDQKLFERCDYIKSLSETLGV